MMGLYRR
jgi:hypothetical protein